MSNDCDNVPVRKELTTPRGVLNPRKQGHGWLSAGDRAVNDIGIAFLDDVLFWGT